MTVVAWAQFAISIVFYLLGAFYVRSGKRAYADAQKLYADAQKFYADSAALCDAALRKRD